MSEEHSGDEKMNSRENRRWMSDLKEMVETIIIYIYCIKYIMDS